MARKHRGDGSDEVNTGIDTILKVARRSARGLIPVARLLTAGLLSALTMIVACHTRQARPTCTDADLAAALGRVRADRPQLLMASIWLNRRRRRVSL